MTSQMDFPVTIRQAKPGEEVYMNDFMARKNWDVSMYDYNGFMALDPNHLLVAEGMTGEPVGFGALVQSTADTVYLDNFIVREDLRKQGIGRQIWNALIERAGDMNIALDSVSHMIDWYDKQGFKFRSFKIKCYNVTILDEMKSKVPSKYKIKPLTEDLWPALLKYDRHVYPHLDRERILRAWFCVQDVRAIVAFDGENVVGYGSIHKKPGKVYGLRNVFGDDENVIESILRELFAAVPVGYVVRLIKVEGKPLPKYIQHSIPTTMVDQRMYTKFLIEVNTEKMWFASTHIL